MTVTVFVAVFFLSAIGLVVWQFQYKDRIYPGISVAGLSLGGKTAAEAKGMVEKKVAAMESGIPVVHDQTRVTITPRTGSMNPDLDQQFVLFDTEASVANAWSLGRGEHWLDNAAEAMTARFSGYPLELSATVDRLALTEALRQSFSQLERPAKNADIELTAEGGASVIAEETGILFDYDKTTSQILNQFRRGDQTQVNVTAQTQMPTIFARDVTAVQSGIDTLMALKPIQLKYEEKKWTLGKSELKSLIGLGKDDNRVVAVLSPEKIKTYLEKEVAPDVDQEVVEAKLTIENGRATVWQAGKDGLKIDMETTAQRIADWPKQPEGEVEVAVTTVASSVPDQSAADLGLKEIIGTGVSNFAGSPANRRHNIRVGAMALHGLLIKPGEEFSLLKALGEIDGKSGYLPELVIKGNKTIPEYGGGLCQIGTTMFRATFNTGLPVTARRNHSYRVVYYEPAGTDATIYDPAPDYKFINDTGNYILIQARLGQNEVAFDFWGTNDGRKAVATKPVIYNIVKPGPTKIIETPDLPEGQKKCTESAHAGADAYFDYSVTYPNGEVKSQRFTSHYIPWQAVCLVGAKKAAPPAPTPGTPTGTAAPAVSNDTN